MAPVTGKSLISAFLNPQSVQYTQRTKPAFTGVTNPAKAAGVAAIKYERAPQQGASVPMTDRNGNPLLADYIIDMGPEGGKDGGEIIFTGLPKDIKSCKTSKTAQFI